VSRVDPRCIKIQDKTTNELFAFILSSDQQSSGIGSSYDLGYREPTSTASQQNGQVPSLKKLYKKMVRS
jgi:hypothetical protein